VTPSSNTRSGSGIGTRAKSRSNEQADDDGAIHKGEQPNKRGLKGAYIDLERSISGSRDRIPQYQSKKEKRVNKKKESSQEYSTVIPATPKHYVTLDDGTEKKDSKESNAVVVEEETANMKERARRMMKKNGFKFREINYDELELEQKIGAGSFGEVFKATWRGAQVAVKRLINMDDDDNEMVEEFLREASMMDLLGNHPNVIKFVGACLEPFCLVSAFCVHGSLEGVLRKDHDFKILSDRTLVRMAMDISAAIHHLHREGVIHRDFGFARIKEKGGDGGNTQSTLGPVRYMSPESLQDRRYSEKSDVYSFGVLLYEMWMREAPYEGTQMDLLQVALRVMNEGLRPTTPPNAPPAIQKLMEQCWSANPADRSNLASIWDTLGDIYLGL